jgi:DNA primase
VNASLAAQSIRDTVDMTTILSLYGYQADRNGFMRCPFHGERTGSLKVYTDGRGWHCYGCGRGGSVVDFVMDHENCDFRTAVIAIDKALHLGLMDPKENAFDSRQQYKIQAWLDLFVGKVQEVCNTLLDGIEMQQRINMDRLKTLQEIKSTPEGLAKLDPKQLYFINSFDEEDNILEYRKEKIKEFKEEVAAWRRKYRRAMT